MDQKFPKSERLKSLKKIQKVISKGKVVRFGCVRIYWLMDKLEDQTIDKTSQKIKAGFSVPKKKIKRATERNKIRRKLKEIFRLHKNQFYENIPDKSQLNLFIIYQNGQNLDYKTIETDLLPALKKINENIIK